MRETTACVDDNLYLIVIHMIYPLKSLHSSTVKERQITDSSCDEMSCPMRYSRSAFRLQMFTRTAPEPTTRRTITSTRGTGGGGGGRRPRGGGGGGGRR